MYTLYMIFNERVKENEKIYTANGIHIYICMYIVYKDEDEQFSSKSVLI